MITQEEAAYVLHYYDHRKGWQGGSFATALIHAFTKADPENTVRLAKGFPGYYEAMRLVRYERRGLDILESIFNQGDA
jgi:hypothetical protein